MIVCEEVYMHINSIQGFNVTPKVNASKRGYTAHYSTLAVNEPTAPINTDTVSFRGKFRPIKLNVTPDKAKFVGNSLSTSTSGHRAPYLSENFTKDIVKLISLGVAGAAIDYAASKQTYEPNVIIGGDTRQATRESLPLIKDTLLRQGVNVYEIEKPVPTPLLALAARELNVDLGVLMTASHNPWNDGGYNIVTKAGAIAPGNVTKDIANYMEKFIESPFQQEAANITAKTTKIDPYNMYVEELDNSGLIDWKKISNSGIKVFYDGLKGTGTYVVPKMLKEKGVFCEEVKSEGQKGPNPTNENLGTLESKVAHSKERLKIGLANDGDADRFGVVDENGKFINANDIILLTGYHLAKNKGRTGAIIRSQATSMQLDKLAQKYGLDLIETPVGFKYIAEDIEDLRKNSKDILVAGEESGGLTVNEHIPEKDGIMAISLMMDLVATEGKPISEILRNVKAELGTYFQINNFSKAFERTEEGEAAKNKVMEKAADLYNNAMNGKTELGSFNIDAKATADVRSRMEKYRKGGDGYKFVLTDGSTVLLRKSGTEPLVKCYIEATGENADAAKAKSKELETVMNQFMA